MDVMSLILSYDADASNENVIFFLLPRHITLQSYSRLGVDAFAIAPIRVGSSWVNSIRLYCQRGEQDSYNLRGIHNSITDLRMRWGGNAPSV